MQWAVVLHKPCAHSSDILLCGLLRILKKKQLLVQNATVQTADLFRFCIFVRK